MTFIIALGLLGLAWYGIQIDSWFTVALAAMGWVGLFPNLKGAALGALVVPLIAFLGFGLAEWQPGAMVMGQMVVYGFKFVVLPLGAALAVAFLWRRRERIARRLVWLRDTIAMRYFS
jgi:hypothetical protein